jgi:hypothetical protein
MKDIFKLSAVTKAGIQSASRPLVRAGRAHLEQLQQRSALLQQVTCRKISWKP